MSNPFQQHGAFSWFELMTSDQEAAKQFYGELFGWSLKDEPVEGMNYTVVKAGDQQVGGIMPLSAPQVETNPPPHWGVYINVDATAKQAVELGATVLVQARDIPDVGRFAVIQDPQGACLSIIAYSEPNAA